MNKSSNRTMFSKMVALLLAFLIAFSGVGIENIAKAEGAISVAEAIANNSGSATVRGYIIGTVATGPKLATSNFANTNLMLADNPSETDVTKMIPVQLPSGALRDAWNLVNHPDNLGKQVDISGNLATYFSVPGLKDAKSIVAVVSSEEPPVDPVDPPVDPVDPVTPEITTIDLVRNGNQGTTYTIKGTVISKENAWGGNGFYVQDETASIYVFPGNANPQGVSIGDTVTVTAALGTFGGEVQLAGLVKTVKGEKTTAPEATVITIIQKENAIIDTLVKLEKVKITNLSKVNEYGTAEFTAVDESGATILVRIDNRSGVTYDIFSKAYKNSDVIDVSGIISRYNGQYQIKPFDMSHFQLIIAGEEPTVPTEALKVGQIQGAGHTSKYVGQTITVKDVVVTSVTGEKQFYVQDINPDGDIKTSDGLAVYNPTTGVSPSVGDKLEIVGGVEEFIGFGFNDRAKTHLTTTQIKPSSIKIVGTADVPEPIVLTDSSIPKGHIDDDSFATFDPENDSIDFWESVEGMVVAVDNAKIVGPQRYGDIYVLPSDTTNKLNNLGGYTLQENQNPDIICILTSIKGYGNKDDNGLITKAGDSFDGRVQGPVTYTYNGYKIDTQVIESAKVVSSVKQDMIVDGGMKPEKTTIEFNEDKLTITEYNVENFSANPSNTSDEKVSKIANSIINQLNQPDIISLVEMQDNDGPDQTDETSADLSAKRLTDEIINQGGHEYTYAEVAPVLNSSGGQPGGNIRVGFIYRADRVSLKSLESIGVENPTFEGTRKPLAGLFDFKGNEVLVVANHWNSKGGDDPLFGKTQPPYLGSELQRKEIALVVNGYISDQLKSKPELMVVANGDFNDFEYREALNIFKGDILTNLVEDHEWGDRFSYFYSGNSQCLDHTFVSKNLVDKVTFDMVHINALFMNIHGRASDHDPQIVQIGFAPSVEPDPEPEKIFDKGYTPGQMNLRLTPNGEIIGEVPALELLEGEVDQENPNWLKVTYQDKEGYVYRPLLADGLVSGHAIGQVNLRTEAMGKIVGSISKGKFVTGVYYDEHPDWVYANVDGEYVYVYSPLLQEEPVADKGYTPGIMNLRLTPNGKVLRSIPRFALLNGTIDPVYTDWLKVNYMGQTGYVYLPFLVEELITETATIKGMTNVRSEASVRAQVIGTLGEGYEIKGTVDPTNPGWLLITYQGRDGYVWRGTYK